MTEADLDALKAPVRSPIDELAAFAQFMVETRHDEAKLERIRVAENDRLLEIAKIIDAAAFVRADEYFAADAALAKARRIVELG